MRTGRGGNVLSWYYIVSVEINGVVEYFVELRRGKNGWYYTTSPDKDDAKQMNGRELSKAKMAILELKFDWVAKIEKCRLYDWEREGTISSRRELY